MRLEKEVVAYEKNDDLDAGAAVEVYIENQEDKKGQLILSHKKARASRSWDRVNEALENEEIVAGAPERKREKKSYARSEEE